MFVLVYTLVMKMRSERGENRGERIAERGERTYWKQVVVK